MDPTNDGLDGIEFKCPKCSTAMDGYRERCPHCGAELDDERYATYRPPIPRAVRIIALILLVGVILIPLALYCWLMLWRP
ncbi:MAG: hypothetical protein KJ749_14295 [Planctomycetes bacterium]|nr:hypothetical protein [Planctomycetota bacterium]